MVKLGNVAIREVTNPNASTKMVNVEYVTTLYATQEGVQMGGIAELRGHDVLITTWIPIEKYRDIVIDQTTEITLKDYLESVVWVYHIALSSLEIEI